MQMNGLRRNEVEVHSKAGVKKIILKIKIALRGQDMKKISIQTRSKKMLSDVYTPVGIYLRLRDRFRDTILLESTDNTSAENSFSFIAINAIGGMEITNYESVELKYPKLQPEKQPIAKVSDVPDMVWNFMQQFDVQQSDEKTVRMVQGLFGYCSYDAVQFFETIELNSK